MWFGCGRSFSVELSGDTSYDVELGPLAISGVVRAERPVLGALVTATPMSAEDGSGGKDGVDSRGSFRIDGLHEGEYTVRVSHPGYGEVSRTVYLGSGIEDLDIYLSSSPTDGRREIGLQWWFPNSVAGKSTCLSAWRAKAISRLPPL